LVTGSPASAVSDARDKIDGVDDKDQGIQVDGKANIVPSTPTAIAFTRTPQEVLRIVYLTDKDGEQKGGFYPSGMNGKIKSTWALALPARQTTISPWPHQAIEVVEEAGSLQ